MKIIQSGFYSLVAKVTASMDTLGLTSDNCSIVYECEGSYKHWEPGGELNAFSTITAGKGYLIVSKDEIDLSDFFDPNSNPKEGIVVYNNTSQAVVPQLVDDSGAVIYALPSLPAGQITTVMKELFGAHSAATGISCKTTGSNISATYTIMFKVSKDDPYQMTRNAAITISTVAADNASLAGLSSLDAGAVFVELNNA